MRTILVLLVGLWVFASCTPLHNDDLPTEGGLDLSTPRDDQDGDGFDITEDCDDANASVYPGALEICDGLDNDCDGDVDIGAIDATLWYQDNDEDGYGDSREVVYGCTRPEGYALAPGDCDDTEPSVHPGAAEICGDGVDNNCDGAVDLGGSGGDLPYWYADMDGDGYGDEAESIRSCNQPATYVSVGGDCDDLDPAIHPGALELCDDGLDNNCDGAIDEADAEGAPSWYPDSDGDGYGDETQGQQSCEPIPDTISTGGDCDDADPTVYSGALEQCDDGVDNDCDGAVDGEDIESWYVDEDGDGYGSDTLTSVGCEAPSGHVSNSDDCDDQDATANPGMDELCLDGVDNDCDGMQDEADAADASSWYLDADADGYGVGEAVGVGCAGPDGTSAQPGDCDDTDPARNPGAQEVCDPEDRDEDCDGLADDADPDVDSSTMVLQYPDRDGDGYAAEGAVQGVLLCDPPDGYATETTDCDDEDSTLYPGAEELEDGIDQDCDGIIDNNTPSSDDDGDGFSENEGDCNDEAAEAYPGGLEVCEGGEATGLDNDCNGQVDDVDQDGDGASPVACGGGDCDDDDPTRYPDAPEDGGNGSGQPNGVDDDCDGQVDEDLPSIDDDGDGFTDDGGDCDDGNPAIYPGAVEFFDAIDQDCDGDPGSTLFLSEAPVTLLGYQAGGAAGFAVDLIPDTNADGSDELLVGSPYYVDAEVETGAAFLIFGKTEGWSRGASLEGSVIMVGEEEGSEAGASVTSVGDFNADGLGDFAVGSPGYPTNGYSRAGAAYLLLGSLNAWSSHQVLGDRSYENYVAGDTDSGKLGTSIYGVYNNVELGYSVGGGGDVNADGFDDLVFGGPCNAYNPSCITANGWLMVLNGRDKAKESAVITDLAKGIGGINAAIGYAVALVGNSDPDAYDDILVGGTYDVDDVGLVARVPGSEDLTAGYGIPWENINAYTGDEAGEWLGQSLAGAGDVDGDGLSDLLIGKDLKTADDQLAYLIYGSTSDAYPEDGSIRGAADVIIHGDEQHECPCAVSGVGDLDQDGFADFLVSASASTGDEADSGMVFLFYGDDNRLTGDVSVDQADVTFVGESAGDLAGFSIAGGGDLNGDGYSDLVIGAPQNDGDVAGVGTIYVYFGFSR